MAIKHIKCPQCGGIIEADTEKQFAVCQNCGKTLKRKNKTPAADRSTNTIKSELPPMPKTEQPAKAQNKSNKKGCLIGAILGIVGMLFVLIILVAVLGTDSDSKQTETSSVPESTVITNESSLQKSTQNITTTTTTTKAETLGQKNALASAKSYLRHSSFSYKGLVEQLEFEGYSNSDATYAVNNCGADWNEQAAKSAQSYISHSSFSRAGLIEQLEFEGFTHEQALYGVKAVGY